MGKLLKPSFPIYKWMIENKNPLTGKFFLSEDIIIKLFITACLNQYDITMGDESNFVIFHLHYYN